jgi:hypothetical protein
MSTSGIPHLPHEKPNASARTDAKKCLCSLIQYFFTVRHEQHPARAHLLGVEGRQPRLAQARGQHHEAALITVHPCFRQRFERLDLNRRRFRRRLLSLRCPAPPAEAAGRDAPHNCRSSRP